MWAGESPTRWIIWLLELSWTVLLTRAQPVPRVTHLVDRRHGRAVGRSGQNWYGPNRPHATTASMAMK